MYFSFSWLLTKTAVGECREGKAKIAVTIYYLK